MCDYPIAYHGRTSESAYFHRSYCGSKGDASYDQHGPGFYFCDDPRVAANYGPHVIEAVLQVDCWVPRERLPEATLRQLLALCPREAYWAAAENWGQDTRAMRRAVARGETAHAQLQNIWYDVYGVKNTAVFLRAVSAYFQGVIIPSCNRGEATIYIVFDPDAIVVVAPTESVKYE